MYNLKNIPLSDFGHTPGQQNSSNMALSGFLDMPARIGKTFHKWAGENGVEPYVSASEIHFGGRDLQLVGYIQGHNKQSTLNKANSLIDFVDSFTDLVPLSCAQGTFNIQVISMPIEYLTDYLFKVTINMREPVVDLSGVLPEPDGAMFGIDGISFEKLGGFLIELGGDNLSRPKIQQQSFTAYGKEGYQITRAEAKVLQLKLFISSPTYLLFSEKIRSLYALFSKPGLRFLNVRDDIIQYFFVTEGFKVLDINIEPSASYGIVSFSGIQVPISYSFDVDNNINLISTVPNTANYTFSLNERGELIMNR